MSKPNVIEKCIGTEIKWTQGSDPTKEKKKKKVKKQGGGKKTVTKEVKVDSFFNFFETIELKEEDKKKGKGDDSDEGENDVGEKMDEDFDLGNDFKDDLIPLALEYYLGVIEQESESDDDDEDGEGDDDSDEEDKKNKKKKGGKGGKGGGGGKAGGAEGDPKQECKQQ